MSEIGYTSLIIILITLLICGSVYLGIAYNYSHKYTGILISGKVFIQTQCSKKSCSNKYYVNEIFIKGVNETNTCTVQRLTPYYFYGSAENVVQKLILNTERTIYQTFYNAGTCFDDKIKMYYETIGYILLLFPVLIIFIFIGLQCLILFEAQLETIYFSSLQNRFHNWMSAIHEAIINLFTCCKRKDYKNTENFESQI